ncbi:MAG: DUF3552 domain-containing protein, partial [Acidobacteria bacterium]|nr:DUF3552 domain-containing protein [Acidobacteriota bacterium]
MFENSNVYVQSLTMFVLFIAVFFSGYFLRWFFANKKLREAESKSKDLLDSAKKDAENTRKEIELHGKDLMIKLRQDFEAETKERREEIQSNEKRLLQKEENLEKRVDLLERKEKDIDVRLQKLQKEEEGYKERSSELTQLISEEKKRL